LAKASAARVGAPRGVEAGAARRPATHNLLVGLTQAQAAHQHRQPARRGERLDRAALEPEFAQARLQPLRKRLFERAQRLRRQFLGAELHQEIAAGHAVGACASIGKPSASRLA
jgi:hypothetical protein